MSRYKLIFSGIAIVAVAAGFALSFWPLSLLGLLCAAAAGQYALAIGIGIFLDAMYGPPIGYLHVLRVPFMLLSIVITLFHYFIAVYFREGDTGRL